MQPSSATSAALRAWIQLVNSWGMTQLCFAEDAFLTRHAPPKAAHPFKERCTGIYCWFTEAAEAYVGQATDIRARLRQHRRNHRDIIAAAFVEVPAECLDAEEQRFVKLAEATLPLRNVKLVQRSVTRLPIDDFLSPAEQDRFLAMGNPQAWKTEMRWNFEMLEVRSRSKRDDFKRHGSATLGLLRFLAFYIPLALPRPAATEQRFWSLTWLGKGMLRLNVGQQEVLTLHGHPEGDVARIICPERIGREVELSPYVTKDHVSFLPLSAAQHAIRKPAVRRAIRERNLHLARHTVPLNSASHCPWLWNEAASPKSVGAVRILRWN